MATIFMNTSNIVRFKRSVFSVLRNKYKYCCRAYSDECNVEESEVIREIQSKPSANEHSIEVPLSSGKTLTINVGKLAKFADGSATVTCNNATVMATVVSRGHSKSGVSFVPLTVTFQQKGAALGRIPLNFLRREYGQNEYEILTSRLIDRSLRPGFPKQFNWETQVICNPLALDGNTFPDVLAINAASAALAVSNIPWNGPVGAVRLGLIDNVVILNPNKKELSESTVNLIVVAKENDYIMMLEGSFANIDLNTVKMIIKTGVKEIKKIVNSIKALAKSFGKTKKTFTAPEVNCELYAEIEKLSASTLEQIFTDYSHDKTSRDEAISTLLKEVEQNVSEKFPNQQSLVVEVFYQIVKKIFRGLIFEKKLRCDGRPLNMLRSINCEVDLYKVLHGSALFQRGQTQVLCTVALDSPNSALKMDRISMLTSGLKEKNFFVHYEFPPFATKEIGRMGPIGRREIGHGALAEKALKANIPDDYPFTIRLTAEVLESNGSSSMATVCGGTLALLDAGIPLKNPCAGVAIGVVTKWSEDPTPEVTDYCILTDILGIEDYYGDMDFKIAGTKKALTALQLDIKTQGLPIRIIMDSLVEGKIAIHTILKKMYDVCSSPRMTRKANWPVIEKVTVPGHLRAKFIGSSGNNIKRLEMSVGVEISEGCAGEFIIFAPNQSAMNEVTEIIKEVLESHKEPTLEFGGVYTATIVEIKERGCMVTLYPTMQPVLVHISQLDHRKVLHASALGMEVGQEIQVKYFGRDPVSGMMRLSRKVLQTTGFSTPQRLFKQDSEKLEKKPSPNPAVAESAGSSSKDAL